MSNVYVDPRISQAAFDYAGAFKASSETPFTARLPYFVHYESTAMAFAAELEKLLSTDLAVVVARPNVVVIRRGESRAGS